MDSEMVTYGYNVASFSFLRQQSYPPPLLFLLPLPIHPQLLYHQSFPTTVRFQICRFLTLMPGIDSVLNTMFKNKFKNNHEPIFKMGNINHCLTICIVIKDLAQSFRNVFYSLAFHKITLNIHVSDVLLLKT